MDDFDDDLHPDLTPLIDVIFMLVIFFIMTMSFTLPTIDFLLPSSSTAQSQEQRKNITISVNKDGEYTYEGQPITREELIGVLQANSEAILQLEIAHDAPVQHMVDVADLAREYGSGRLSIAAMLREEVGGVQP